MDEQVHNSMKNKITDKRMQERIWQLKTDIEISNTHKNFLFTNNPRLQIKTVG